MRRTLTSAAAVLLACAAAGPATAAPTGGGGPEARTHLDLQGHRGARGLRPENTLAAFGKALQVGVTTLELDTGMTQDGVIVVSHERRIASLECQDTAPATPGDPEYPYVGKLIKDLTYAQIRTLDCGTRRPADPATDPFVGTQEPVPGSRMPTLRQVFDLADRYGAHKVRFNIETKIDPTLPEETFGPWRFASRVMRTIRADGKLRRSSIQSFDWRTLRVARRHSKVIDVVALAQPTTVQEGLPGASPWLAGLDVDDPRFGGDVARAAAHIDADVLSPLYGSGAWGTPAFAWYLTPAMITSAHRLGLDVVPWTVNDPAALRAVLDLDIDGIITDYPDRARVAMAERGLRLPRAYPSPFDVQGHRGARSARPENTLPAFAYAIAAGVDTLELDTGVTEDGVLVVIHDRRVNATHCADTGPAVPGDPEYPYAGKLIRDLTLAQLRTLDCGLTDPGFPDQVAQPGARLPTLQEVFDLVEASGSDVRFNIETKISPLVDDTAPYDVFTGKLVDAIEENGLEDRATIQSFDWRTIRLAKQLNAEIGTVALVWQFAGADCDNLDDECSLEAVVGDPSVTSPWTGGLDWWDFRDLGRLVQAAGADVVSANWQVHDPHQGTVASTDWYAKEDPAIYHGPSVRTLQRRGLRVIPYTINDEATMQRVIDLGVDGIISDDVDLLILVARRNGLD